MVADTVRTLLGLVLGRLGSALRALVELHLRVLRREAQADAQRLGTAAALVLLGALLSAVALLVLNGAVAAVLAAWLGSWPLALGALGGGELLLGLGAAGLGLREATRKPLLSESRAMIAETVKNLQQP